MAPNAVSDLQRSDKSVENVMTIGSPRPNLVVQRTVRDKASRTVPDLER